jgi:hypothetical protein
VLLVRLGALFYQPFAATGHLQLRFEGRNPITFSVARQPRD